MTEKEKVMAAIAAAGDALKKMFPDVEFKITAEGDEPKEARSHPLEDLLESLNIQAPAALRTPAAHVEVFGSAGQLKAACVTPIEKHDDGLDEEIDRLVEAIFAEGEDDESDGEKGCVCHGCEECPGCEGCPGEDDCETYTLNEDVCAIPEAECSMVNVYFGNNLEDMQVSQCGSASQTTVAAALLYAALDAMPDWPDEKWHDFLDCMEELAWMLERIDE